jgi:hypothetical protein
MLDPSRTNTNKSGYVQRPSGLAVSPEVHELVKAIASANGWKLRITTERIVRDYAMRRPSLRHLVQHDAAPARANYELEKVL